MAITDLQKTDYLWKKVGFSVAKTDYANAKSASNESIASPLVLRGDTIWQQSSSIPSAIPAANTSIINVYNDTANTTVQTTNDGTAQANRTWLTGLTNWVDASFGSTYQVKVYIANTGWYNAQTSGTQVFADGSGNQDEWFFDYSSGVLNFMGNNLPTYSNLTPISFSGKSVYVSGARYTGATGLANLSLQTTYSNIVTFNSNVNANANLIVSNVLTVNGNITTGNLSTVGNITAYRFYGDGSQLSGVSSYSNANVASYLPTYSGNLAAGNITTSGNITAYSFYGDGSHLTGVTSYSNANVASYLPVYGGNIGAYNVNANIYTSNIGASSANANIFITPGANGYVSVNTNTAFQVPVGTNTSYPPVNRVGMLRWNSDLGYLEVYTGATWEAVGIEGGTTNVVSDVISSGNGVTTQFYLSQNNTTTGTLVSINGVIQLPTTSYTVSGNVITFNEAPLSTDIIEVRQYVPSTTVGNLSSGNASLSMTFINGISTAQFINDGLTTLTVDSANVNVFSQLQVSQPIVANVANTAVNTTTAIIDDFSPLQYRTAKYVISAQNYNSNYFQSAEALVTHNGTTANVVTYATISTNTQLFTLSANIYNSMVSLWATTSTNNNNIKVSATYIPI
jgi:hypothetical protein